jgi:hypothetical protein
MNEEVISLQRSVSRHRSSAYHAKPSIGEDPAQAFSLEPDGSFVGAGVHVVVFTIDMAP